jgi:hypothetical protein
MTTEVTSFDKLIDEFSNINVVIEIGPQRLRVGDSESIEISDNGKLDVIYKYEYDFYVKFQNETKVYYNTQFRYAINYLKKIDELRLIFYKELSNEINNFKNPTNILNRLSDYKLRFSELRDNFFNIFYEINGQKIEFIGNKIIHAHYTEIKPIYDYDRARILNGFLLIQFDAIKKIIKYLKEKIRLIESVPVIPNLNSISNSESKKTIQREYPAKSFTLNPDKFKTEQIIGEKLKEFHLALYKYGFIDKIEYRYFHDAFCNKKPVKQIRWEKNANELYYLIKTLHDKEIIVHFKNYWDVTCKCFIAYHKKIRSCTPYSLSRCHDPKRGEILRRLNSVIDILN